MAVETTVVFRDDQYQPDEYAEDYADAVTRWLEDVHGITVLHIEYEEV